MSDKGRAYVIEHSPYTGAAYFIHYMLGDLENSSHDHRLFTGDDWIAKATRTSIRTVQRTKTQMVADGFLELLDGRSGRGRHQEYRFLFPENGRQGVVRSDPPSGDISSTSGDKVSSDSPPLPLLIQTEEELKNTRDDSDFESLWESYPKRNGVRAGKALALKEWTKLSKADRSAALEALPSYATRCGDFPKDCERYLKHRVWVDYLNLPVLMPGPSNGCSTSIPHRMTSHDNGMAALDAYCPEP